MPQSERPSSLEEHSSNSNSNSNANSNSNSEHYNMIRLQHDLDELFEEQQMLLDIMAQQQERLERQLELQRQLTATEPPPRAATPLPELLLEEIGDEVTEADVKLPELEAQPETEVLGTVLEQQQKQQREPKTRLLTRRRCFCAQVRRQPKEPVTQSRTRTVGQCSPPKVTGLGYDSPFPYPKHLSKGRYRRALYIYSVVNNLVLRMQQFMTLTNNSNSNNDSNICFPLPPPRASIVITELPKETVTLTSAKTKLKPTPTRATTTSTTTSTTKGALPKLKPKLKPKHKRFEQSVIAASSKQIQATNTQRSRKRPRTTTLMEQEIDMDCEFGMDHIQKFRLNRVREDSMNQHNRTHLTGQSMSLVSNQMDEDDLSAALNGLKLFDDAEPQSKQLKTDWSRPESQLDTRPCTPELQHPGELNNSTTPALLPAVLESNGFIDLMPSTSAQARAQALSMHPHGSSSVSSASTPPYAEYSPLNTPPKSPQQQQPPTAEAPQCQPIEKKKQKTEESEGEKPKRLLSKRKLLRPSHQNESDLETAISLVRKAAGQRIRIKPLDSKDAQYKFLPKWMRPDVTIAQTNCQKKNNR